MNEIEGKKETKKVLGVKRALEISVCREMERERDKYMLLHDFSFSYTFGIHSTPNIHI
jgi:hypothetical protein